MIQIFIYCMQFFILFYFFSLRIMPRTPVASNIRATVSGNTLEPEMMGQLTQHKNEIARLISCTTSMQEHITQQSELAASLYSKLGDLKRDILLKGLNIDIPRGPEIQTPCGNRR